MSGATVLAGAALASSASAHARPSSQKRFTGKTVLITGGTSGIGAAKIKAFAAEGAIVTFNGRRAELGRAVETEIRDAGGTAQYIQSDVRDRDQVFGFVEQTMEKFGRLDIAFNNAGIAIPPSPLEETTIEGYRDIIRTNIDGVFYAIQAQLPIMKAAGAGVIINTSSAFGSHAPNTQVAYGATKGAVEAITEGVAKEAGPSGVRVLAVAPGAITQTDLFRFIGRDWTTEEVAFFGTLAAMGRAGTPDEIAKVVLALSSDEGSFVTGATIPIDGQFLQA